MNLTINWIELAGAVLGLINIVLLVRRSVWNFPAAMAMVSLIGFTLIEARLYAEAGLQVFFFVVNIWGWLLWHRARGNDLDVVPVRWMDSGQRFYWLVATAALSLSLGWLLDRFTDAALPFADSAVAGASIAAQLLLSFRRVENWLVWIVIDLTSVTLYLNRELYFLAGLYGVFLVMSVVGWRQWRTAAGPRAR